MMHRPVHVFATLTMAMTVATGGAEGATFTARDLAAEEGKFAAYSVKNDMRLAFLEFFAEDAVILRPGPVDAKAWLATSTAPAIVLDWKSQLTILSASRDLGFSTGPSIYTSKSDAKAPPAAGAGAGAGFGQFFSVWKKQANGEWKVLLDHGISTPVHALADKPLAARDLPENSASAAREAGNAEVDFIARSSAAGAIVAYDEAIAADSRLLRADRVPIDGAVAIREYLKSVAGKWSWSVIKQGASQANDFSYALGSYSRQAGDGAEEKGYYIRVWVKDPKQSAARWVLAGEVLTPLPPKK